MEDSEYKDVDDRYDPEEDLLSEGIRHSSQRNYDDNSDLTISDDNGDSSSLAELGSREVIKQGKDDSEDSNAPSQDDSGDLNSPSQDDSGDSNSPSQDDSGDSNSQSQDDSGDSNSPSRSNSGDTNSPNQDDSGDSNSQSRGNSGDSNSQISDSSGDLNSQISDDNAELKRSLATDDNGDSDQDSVAIPIEDLEQAAAAPPSPILSVSDASSQTMELPRFCKKRSHNEAAHLAAGASMTIAGVVGCTVALVKADRPIGWAASSFSLGVLGVFVLGRAIMKVCCCPS